MWVGSVWAEDSNSLLCDEVSCKENKSSPDADDKNLADIQYIALELPLRLDGIYLGDISAEVSLDGHARVPLGRIRELLSDNSSYEEMVAILVTLEEKLGALPNLASLRENNILINYDAAALSVDLEIPRTGAQSIILRSPRNADPYSDTYIAPAEFAAGFTTILRPTIVHKALRGGTGVQPLDAEIRGFFSFGGFDGAALVYNFDFRGGSETKWRRGDATLIHDDFENAVRYQLGDIRPSVFRFQSSVDLLGLSIERNYQAIQPFKNLRPSGRNEFTLERTSIVSFRVNGVIISTQELGPGLYRATDFPFVTGANDVDILVDDEFGVRELGRFSSYVDTALLSKGITSFGFNIGVLRNTGSNGIQPDYSDEIAAVGFVEHGLTENFSLSARFEASEDTQLVGFSSVAGTPLGLFALETALSRNLDGDFGQAHALRYAWRAGSTSGLSPELDAQISYRDANFLSLGSNGVPFGEEIAFTGRSTMRYRNVSLNVGGSWREQNAQRTSSISTFLTAPIYGMSASLGYQHLRSSTQDPDNRLIFSVSRNFGNGFSVRTRYTTNPTDIQAEIRKTSDRSVGDVFGRISGATVERQREYTANVGYISSRFEAEIRNSSTSEEDSSSVNSSRTTGRLGLGFGYANGSLAWGRPFTDGFAIIKRHKSIADKKISIRRNQSGPLTGQLGTGMSALGPLIAPLNGAYRNQAQAIEVDDLPPGYDIGDGTVNLFPGVRSGYLYVVGSDASNTVLGSLVTADGEPVSLSIGEFRSVEDPDADPIEFFTNRTGRFVAEQVKAGQYDIYLKPNDSFLGRINVEQDENSSGIIDVGVISKSSLEE